VEIQVCIGSGCHLKGAHYVIKRLKELVAEHNAAKTIRLTASFCQEMCTEGVAVRINGVVVKHVSTDNIDTIFYEAVAR
jgi:NADH:ubiquinone oxidoreductase subunit E